MIRYRFRSRQAQQMEELDTPRAGVWIEVQGPIAKEEVELLAQRHDLDAALLNDALDFFEAPRFESESGVAYFFTRYPALVADEVSTAPLLVAVGEDFVLTVAPESTEFLDSLEKSPHVFTTQKTKFFLQIADAIAREYTKSIANIRRDVRRQRLRVRDVSERTIERSVHFEYALNEFVSALVPTNIALARALSSPNFPLFEEDEDLLEDVQLANNQLIETAKTTLKTIQNIRDAHATLVSNRLNRTVKTLTALTILLTIPTIVGTFYGMNVPLPYSDHPAAFAGILGLVMVLTGAVGYLFWRNRWF